MNPNFLLFNESEQKKMESYFSSETFETMIRLFQNLHVAEVIRSRNNKLIFKEWIAEHIY